MNGLVTLTMTLQRYQLRTHPMTFFNFRIQDNKNSMTRFLSTHVYVWLLNSIKYLVCAFATDGRIHVDSAMVRHSVTGTFCVELFS